MSEQKEQTSENIENQNAVPNEDQHVLSTDPNDQQLVAEKIIELNKEILDSKNRDQFIHSFSNSEGSDQEIGIKNVLLNKSCSTDNNKSKKASSQIKKTNKLIKDLN